jgi:predicted RNA methylase
VSLFPLSKPHHLVTVLALAAAAILLGAWELAVTRLASVVYFFDLTYLALAVCLFGLGAGALWTRRYGARLRLTVVLVLLPTLMPISWWLISRYDAAWIGGLFALPFVLFGAASTLAFHRMTNPGARVHLYAAEVVGAALGLVLVGPMVVPWLPMDVLGEIGIETHLRDVVDREGLREHRYEASAYARTDLVHTNRESVAYVFTDAMFVTRAVQWDGQSTVFDDPHVEDLARLKRLALLSGTGGGEGDRVLLLGAGAGFDMALALQSGAERIDAVEVNPQTIEFGRELDAWAGGVLSNPKVRIHLAEARRFMAGSSERWDHINLTLLQTSPATGRGRSHVDGRVLTVEAVQTYLDHLRPLGILAVIQNSALLAERTRLSVLAANGGRSDRIVELRLPIFEDEYNPFNHLLLARNEAFDDPELDRIRLLASQFGAELVLDQTGLDGRPATDNRPFLFEPGFRIVAYALVAGALALMALVAVLTWERKAPGNIVRGSAAALVGMVTMALQVLVVYRVQSAVGSPALAIGLALASVLVGAGMGALLLGGRFLQPGMWRRTGILAAGGVMVLTLAGPTIAEISANVEAIPAAALLITTFTAICCMPAGLPFLAVIQSCRSVAGHGEGLAIGCDGIGGIIGAAGATIVAMTMGFNMLGWLLVVGFAGFALLEPAGAEDP